MDNEKLGIRLPVRNGLTTTENDQVRKLIKEMKMVKVLLAAIIGILVFGFVLERGSAQAATITVETRVEEGTKYILYNGGVEVGDLTKLKLAYSEIPTDYPYVSLVLNSPGGSGAEMRKIIEWMEDKQIHTHVHDGYKCYSACAAIWTFGDYRTVGEDSELGYHIGSITDGEFHSDYVRDYGVLGLQHFLQQSIAEDYLWYTEFPVNQPLKFVQNILKDGNNSITFYEPDLTDLDIVIGLIDTPEGN